MVLLRQLLRLFPVVRVRGISHLWRLCLKTEKCCIRRINSKVGRQWGTSESTVFFTSCIWSILKAAQIYPSPPLTPHDPVCVRERGLVEKGQAPNLKPAPGTASCSFLCNNSTLALYNFWVHLYQEMSGAVFKYLLC